MGPEYVSNDSQSKLRDTAGDAKCLEEEKSIRSL